MNTSSSKLPGLDTSAIIRRGTGLVNRLVAPAGVHLSRTDSVGRTWTTLFDHLADRGFAPTLVVDVGAADGTPALYEAYPSVRHVWFEPQEECRAGLDEFAKGMNVRIVTAIASDSAGTQTLHIHDDLIGSSVFCEVEGGGSDGESRTVDAVTLDDELRDEPTESVLLKVDVQGAELAVLRGAPDLLEHVDVAIIECSLIPTLQDSPDAYEVIAFMREHGFVIYDMIGGLQRPLDDALAQVDFVFVPVDHPYRSDRRWTAADRIG